MIDAPFRCQIVAIVNFIGATMPCADFDQILAGFRYNPRPSFRPLRLRGYLHEADRQSLPGNHHQEPPGAQAVHPAAGEEYPHRAP
jgi:hypothetical protein